MLNFLYGILLMVFALPIVQQLTTLIVTLLDYWTTLIAAKTVRIQAQLDKEQIETQMELQDKQMEGQERCSAIGFHVIDEEALEDED